MQRKINLFERLESKPTMLFKRSDFGQVKCDVLTDSLPQFNFFKKSLRDINSSDSSFFVTPPMENKFVVTPKAPVKNKKESKRADLKPKRLQYTEEELDADNAQNVKDTVPEKSGNALLRKRDSVQCNKVNSTEKRITRSQAKLDIKPQTIDKENDSTAINNRSRNTSIVRNNLTRVSSIVNDSCSEELSQCDSSLDWKGKLRWLQSRRDVGLWVECCRRECKKLRYTEEYHDPLDVPEIWYCEMNFDKTIASCAIPQVPMAPALEADLIENCYNAGSIVWARVQGYPWWPAIVCDSPDTFRYYEQNNRSQKPIKYFVTFFNDVLECAWLHKHYLKPFARTKYSTLITRTIFHKVDYKSSLDKWYEIALSALRLSISERLQKFSYLALYEKMHDVNNNDTKTIEEEMETNSDEEIPSSAPTNSLSLRDYYFMFLCKANCNTSDECSY
ncbi:uncharacterized protein LOC143213868 [Lasioglossum baleicum]|uniref:uncharacterized protein LOC143213868 n=1 Tax=Lasioglossum baleicum TaxID=434251 RepID=UPI003FCCA74A